MYAGSLGHENVVRVLCVFKILIKSGIGIELNAKRYSFSPNLSIPTEFLDVKPCQSFSRPNSASVMILEILLMTSGSGEEDILEEGLRELIEEVGVHGVLCKNLLT